MVSITLFCLLSFIRIKKSKKKKEKRIEKSTIFSKRKIYSRRIKFRSLQIIGCKEMQVPLNIRIWLDKFLSFGNLLVVQNYIYSSSSFFPKYIYAFVCHSKSPIAVASIDWAYNVCLGKMLTSNF